LIFSRRHTPNPIQRISVLIRKVTHPLGELAERSNSAYWGWVDFYVFLAVCDPCLRAIFGLSSGGELLFELLREFWKALKVTLFNHFEFLLRHLGFQQFIVLLISFLALFSNNGILEFVLFSHFFFTQRNLGLQQLHRFHQSTALFPSLLILFSYWLQYRLCNWVLEFTLLNRFLLTLTDSLF
jgi:hypothetical protein